MWYNDRQRIGKEGLTMARWIIDPDHACATFAVRHFMIANVVGLFGKMTGVITFEPLDIIHLSAEAEIDVGSISTGNKERDEHLLSPDFFDIAQFPKITFRTTRVEAAGDNRGKVTADLTIRGMTRPISFEAEWLGPVKSPFSGKSSIGFRGVTKINREDYGTELGYTMEGGGLVVGKDIDITFDVQADLPD
jgi:polyisoprenoid-binding protein YceI